MLSLHQVHSHYGESHILQGVDLAVPRASLVVLLGRNGMGKTTMMHNIIGFHKPSQGQIIFKNKSIQNLEAYQITRMGMAIVPQGKRVFPSLSVKENLLIALSGSGMLMVKQELNKVFNQFPILAERIEHKANQLSGGEQQILAIARVLLRKPDLILMDEPFEGLAPNNFKSIELIIAELKAAGLSILLVDHNIKTAFSFADYVYILNKGKIVHEGTVSKLQEDREMIKKYLAL